MRKIKKHISRRKTENYWLHWYRYQHSSIIMECQKINLLDDKANEPTISYRTVIIINSNLEQTIGLK